MKLILENDFLLFSELPKFCLQLSSVIEMPYIFLLNGELGAGKTSFVKALLQFNINKEKDLLFENKSHLSLVSSPTYSLHHEYKLNNELIHHYDLYRINNESELETLGFWEIFYQSDSIIIEWPSKLKWEKILSTKNIYEFNFSVVDIDHRKVTVFKRP